MVVPLALNNIEIQLGLKGRNKSFSTFSSETDVVGLSALVVYMLIEIYVLQTH